MRDRDAASFIADHASNGWWFFLVDPVSKKSLRKIRTEYVDAQSGELEDDDDGDDEDGA